MALDQILALVVLVGVVAALIWDKIRSDVVALSGAAALLATGTVRPVEVQGAFASPALIALASLFVIAYSLEVSGVLDLLIRLATRLCRRMGAIGLWGVIALCGVASAFLNNTPIVVLAAPVVRDVAKSIEITPKRFLIPLSYISVLGGSCTLIGTSTNLLVNDMARNAGQPTFGLFEMTPVGLFIALAGSAYLLIIGSRLLSDGSGETSELPADMGQAESSYAGDPAVFQPPRALDVRRAVLAVSIFAGVVVVAGLGLLPIAASAFAGAVLLILLRVITAEEAYRGLRPEVLLLIAGMVVVGLSLEVTGLASAATSLFSGATQTLGPFGALILLYGATLFLTEILSNAAVAVLLTPVAVALAETLGVSPRPFLIGVMMAASAAFATPFGYQTNVLVFQVGGYSYMDFVRVGLPLNLLAWVVAVITIPMFFPF
ncbi:MAG: SLC13 family permease [Pseudomonadota bacterium]|nr:SLC13 family permease [Pseudomonadota bacterium]